MDSPDSEQQRYPCSVDRETRKKYPCLFVHEGAIHMYDGTMFEFYTQLQPDEWSTIVIDTIKYKLFMEALKTVGMPRLSEPWTQTCEYFLLGLEVNLYRMHKLDSLLFTKVDSVKTLSAYKDKMKVNSVQVLDQIRQLRAGAADIGASIDLRIVSDI